MSEASIEIEATASISFSGNQDDASGISREDNMKISQISKNSSNSSASGLVNSEDSTENPNPVENLVDFLKYKGLSDDLKNRLLIDGPTDETIRLLKALGFSNHDIKILISLWHIEIQDNEYLYDKPIKSDLSFIEEDASSPSLYLKENFSLVLKQALREVLARKPYDPIEFLGHWLLNFTICEERARIRKDLDDELMVEREKQKKPQMADTIFELPEEDEAEDFNEDWNFVHYEEA